MSGGRKTGALSPDDLELFQQSVDDVTPIDQDRRPAPAPKPRAPEAAPRRRPALRRDAGPRPAAPAPARLADHDPGRVPGLDRRTAQRLRRGEVGIEARLDLHGMSQGTARETLLRFISDCHVRGKRCVLVITGKGRSSGGGRDGAAAEAAGVLRRRVPGWLSDPSVAGRIIAQSPAIPAHGGDGALYVLLRRKRTQ